MTTGKGIYDDDSSGSDDADSTGGKGSGTTKDPENDTPDVDKGSSEPTA